jgi:catechol 2,3-dioxygenase-like lactoylglutathione lyase family enzyme
MADDLHINAIGQIHISVGDVGRAVEFYRDTLGMTLLFEVPGQPMAFFDCGGVRLYLGTPEKPEFSSNPMIYYRVASIRDAYDALRERGVEFSGEPNMVHKTEASELWIVGFNDPDGNNLVLMSEVPV